MGSEWGRGCDPREYYLIQARLRETVVVGDSTFAEWQCLRMMYEEEGDEED
jgi:hypothetical protein